MINQYLADTLDQAVFNAVKNAGTGYFTVPLAFMPREFQVAAFRFGHSQVRPGYRINVLFGAPIFDATIHRTERDPNDLRGGHRASRRFVEWDTFLDFGTIEVAPPTALSQPPVVRPKVKENKLIDTILSSPVFDLPVGPGLADDPLVSLAGRNLQRHLMHGLVSGRGAAGALGYPALPSGSFSELAALGFEQSTPLWYYILREAHTQQSGRRLGQVGSRIVAEMIFALLRSDPHSYLAQQPNWTPDFPRRNGGAGAFTMVDFLTFAGVVLTSHAIRGPVTDETPLFEVDARYARLWAALSPRPSGVPGAH